MRIFTGNQTDPEERVAALLFLGDVPSAFHALRDRPQPAREAFIIELAESALSGKIEISNGNGGLKKAILPPNAMIGLLRIITGDGRTRLAELFLGHCEKRGWPGTRITIFRLLRMEPDSRTIATVRERIFGRILRPAAEKTMVTA